MRELIRSALPPRRTSRRVDKIEDAAVTEAAFRAAEQLLSTTRPEIIASRKIVEAMRTGIEESCEAGLEREQLVFDECMQSLPTRNKIYLFFGTRQTGKIAELAGADTRPLTKAAVVGMGSMGTGIAQAFIEANVPVVVLDQSDAVLTQGAGRIRDSLQKRVARGELSDSRSEQALRLMTTTTGWEELAGTDLVIESVFEDADVKRRIISQLESVCGADTVLATNTSTIPLEQLASGMGHPQRLIGMHFFNPAHRMPLVEIVRCDDTPPHVLASAIDWSRKLRKTPVLVASRAGFLVTRMFVPYVQEAFRLLEEGAEAERIDQAAVDFGFPMGPLVLMDMTGLDILADSQRVLASAFPRHRNPSQIVASLAQRGHLGQKTGAGVYRYEPGSKVPHACPATAELVATARQQRGLVPRSIGKDEIAERLVLRLVNEAFYVLHEGVARSETDVDVASVLGIGFPDFRGGVLKYANDLGLHRVLARLNALSEQLGERFSPCEFLQQKDIDRKGS